MSQQQQGGLSKLITQQKKTFYQFTNQLVSSQFNLKLYYVLIIIQHFQIVAYQCHSVYQYKGFGVQYFRFLANSLNPQYYLKTTNLMNYFIPICFFLVALHIGLFGYSYYQHKQKGISKDVIELKKNSLLIITHYMTIFMTTALTIPIFLTSLLAVYCHAQSPYHINRTCYDTYHLFLVLMSLVNIVWVLGINVYNFLLYYTNNPFKSQNFLSLSSSLWNLLKFAVKVVPPAYLIFDQKLEYYILYVFGIAAGLIGYTGISRVLYPYKRYNKYIERVMISIQIISISTSITFILQAFFSKSIGIDITFMVSFIFSIPLAKLSYQMIMDKKQKMILKINEFQKDNIDLIEEVLINLIFELQDQSKKLNQKRFFKVIKFHHDKCQNVQCNCHNYMKKFKQSDQYFEDKVQIYLIFLQIIDRMVQVHKKPYSLMLLKGYIQYFKLNNTIKAAFIISKFMKEKISFFHDYLISGFLYQISKTFQDNTSMEKYRVFSQHLIKFQKQAIKLAQQYQEFWHEIGQLNSSLLKILNLLKRTMISKKNIDQEFKILYEIYPNNIRITEIYKELYKQILIDYDEFMKIQGIHKDNCKQPEESKLLRTLNQMNFTPNQDLIVINTSVNVSNDIFRGGSQIISVTNNVYKILGYSSQDLIGKNINRFLPKIYTQFHDQIIKDYLNKSDGEIKIRQLIIFPINSNGHLVECAMLNKIMPSIDYGATIVSFLLNSKLSKENIIIYDQRTGLVDSMSQKAQILLLGKKSKNNSISIPDHITDILPVWDYTKQQMNEYKKKSAQQLKIAYSNVCLYRSDGPQNNKYVKVVTFELAFQSKIFSFNECLEDTTNLWLGFQTLVENSPYKQNLIKLQLKKQEIDDEGKQDFNQSPSPILLQKSSKASPAQDLNIFAAVPEMYHKIYVIIQVIILIALISEVIYSYADTLKYYEMLENDIVTKQKIQDVIALVLQESHAATEYVYQRDEPALKDHINPQVNIQNLKELITTGQEVYQQIIKKQKVGQISMSDLMLEVKYYTTNNTTIIKQQTVTDASYQFVLYLIEIYNNDNPLLQLPSNILFVFKNCIDIEKQLENLNEVFTANLIRNSQQFISMIFRQRKYETFVLIVTILMLFAISSIWQSIYKIMITIKINRIIEIYEAIPIQELEKFPKKCQNFVKYVCPVQPLKNDISNTIRTIKNLGNDLMAKNQPKASLNSFDPLIQEEQEIQYIKFSKNYSFLYIMFQGIVFVLIFSIFYVTTLASQDNLLNKNIQEVADWNRMTRFKSSILQTVYFLSEYKNIGNQWNEAQLIQIKKLFHQSTQRISYLLANSPLLDKYQAWTYRLIEQSEFILNNSDVTLQQLLTNEQKLYQLADQIQEVQVDSQIELAMHKTITSFLSMMQLIFIGQILIYLSYTLFYIPKAYRWYIEKNLITKLMYDTLGYRLQSIAKNNLQSK